MKLNIETGRKFVEAVNKKYVCLYDDAIKQTTVGNAINSALHGVNYNYSKIIERIK